MPLGLVTDDHGNKRLTSLYIIGVKESITIRVTNY